VAEKVRALALFEETKGEKGEVKLAFTLAKDGSIIDEPAVIETDNPDLIPFAVKAIKEAFNYDNRIIIEKYIDGIELTCGVIGNTNLQTLPIIQIVPDKKYAFFDYDAKYKPGATNEICPAPIDANIAIQVSELAKKAHTVLNCRGCSRTDMILKDDLLFVLETNTIPGMTPTSLLPLSAKAAGIKFSELLDRLIELGREAV